MTDTPAPQPHDDGRDEDLESVLRRVFGDSYDPQMADALRQMGLNRIDPSMVPFLQQQVQAMMTPPAPGGSAIDEAVATRVATELVAEAGDVEIGEGPARDVAQVVQVANLWLDAVTDLPAAGGRAQAWSRDAWVRATMPVWCQVAEPVAEGVSVAMYRAMSEQMNRALQEGVEIPGMPPGMSQAALASHMEPMMRRMSSAMFSMQLGQAVGGLAADVVSGTEIGLPLVRREDVAMLPANVAALAEDLDLEPAQVHLYLAVREAARARLFAEVAWLGPQLLESVRAYARDITLDTESIERQVAEAGTQDPQELQALLADSLFSPEHSAAQQAALSRLETYLALVEGWVDVVAQRAVAKHLPDTEKLAEAIRRRRASGGPAETALANLIGLQLRPRRMRDAANLWAAIEATDGPAGRDAAWAHPDIAPTAADLDDPLGYAQRRSEATAQTAGMDQELDAMLREGEAEGGSAGADDGPHGHA